MMMMVMARRRGVAVVATGAVMGDAMMRRTMSGRVMSGGMMRRGVVGVMMRAGEGRCARQGQSQCRHEREKDRFHGFNSQVRGPRIAIRTQAGRSVQAIAAAPIKGMG